MNLKSMVYLVEWWNMWEGYTFPYYGIARENCSP